MDFSFFNDGQIKKDRGLLEASRNNDTQAIQHWLLTGANPNAVDEDNNAALHWAARHGNDEATALLLKTKADVNQQGKEGVTALIFATKHNHFSTIQLLLSGNANPNIGDRHGFSPLVLAAQAGNTKIAKLFLDKSLEDNNSHLSLLHSAKHGLIDMVSLLLQAGVKINPRECILHNTPLHLAAQNGHIKIVELLLKAGALDALQNNPDDSPFHFVFEGERTTVVRKNGPAKNSSLNVYGETPLSLAVQGGHIEIVRLLLQAGADSNVQNIEGRTAIFWAVLGRYTEIVALLLDTGANSNLQDKNGDTAIFLAVLQGDIKTVLLLIKNGANIEIKNIHGLTPLHVASMKGHDNIVVALLNNSANKNAQDNNNLTPLYTSVHHQRYKIVKLLIQAGADVNLPDINCNTPLHVATAKDDILIAALLLQAGANKNLQNTKIIPLQAAKSVQMVLCFLNFMSTEEINTAITMIPSFDRGVIAFQKMLSDNLRHLYAMFGSCALAADKLYYPQQQTLELLANQVSFRFPLWYRHRIITDLQAIFQIPSKLKAKEEVQNVDALLNQSVYTPSLSNALKGIDPVTEEHKRKRENNDDHDKPKRRKLNTSES